MVTQKHAKFVSKTCYFLSHVGSVSVSLGVPWMVVKATFYWTFQIILALQVLRIHLSELEKVQELSKDFCNRYICALKGKMQSENLVRNDTGGYDSDDSGSGYGGASHMIARPVPVASVTPGIPPAAIPYSPSSNEVVKSFNQRLFRIILSYLNLTLTY